MDHAPTVGKVAGQDPLEAAFERHLRATERAAQRDARHWQQLLGRALYLDFRRFARQLGPAPPLRRDSPAVLILPGLLGSKLGQRNHAIWFNPLAIALGELPALALPESTAPDTHCTATSVLPFIYLRLRWRLRQAGFRVAYWPYDWRESPETLAHRLCQTLDGESVGARHLVAHSYGGLIAARAAAADPQATRIGRVVTLGTPFLGTWAAHRALHGDDPLVNRLAWLDLHHSAAELRASPVSSWTSLHALCVHRDDRAAIGELALPAPGRLGCIVASGRPTPVGHDAAGYHLSRVGDGTVAVLSAAAPSRRGHAVCRVVGSHGSLPSAPAVGAAVVAFLQSGSFPTRAKAPSRSARRAAAGRAQRNTPARDWQQLPGGDRLRFLAEWVTPVEGAAPLLQPPPIPEWRVHCGLPGEADVEVVVVGVFRHVVPAGLLSALDGTQAAREALSSGRFLARVGEVHALPARRKWPRLVLAGLGDFDALSTGTIEMATAATLAWARANGVQRLGLGLFGTRSGLSAAAALAAQRRGLDPLGRSLAVCWLTRHPRRAARLRQRLGLPPQPAPPASLPRAADPLLPDYLLVRQEQEGRRTVLRATLLRGRAKAALPTGSTAMDARSQAKVLSALAVGGKAGIDAAGRALAALLPASVSAALTQFPADAKRQPLVVVHDLAASRWPWETLGLGDTGHRPAIVGGLSRHLESPSLDAARWQRQRPATAPLPVLLVMNPTQDLAGAEEEGSRLRALWSQDPRLTLTVLAGREATRARLLEAFRSGRFDWVHYAGHALFDEIHPGDSGLLCARRERLRGSDLAGLLEPPRLLVANACESGRVRDGRGPRAARSARAAAEAAQAASLAEAFLSAGITHYLGTWWPVADGPAARFAATFHAEVLAGASCGAAVLSARQAVRHDGSSDWADYLHYGDPGSVLLPR